MSRRNSRVNVRLLRDIQAYNFAVLETILYLDTHPTDQNVLDLHNQLAAEYNELVHKYQRQYGPIYSYYPDADYPWQWINEPWPWEIEY